jgi:hypothetical protein
MEKRSNFLFFRKYTQNREGLEDDQSAELAREKIVPSYNTAGGRKFLYRFLKQ